MARSGRKPKAENGWEIVEVERHGWIKFHPERGNIDGHCAYHAKCKLDRRAKNAPLGLVCAWLERGARKGYDRNMHFADRVGLSLDVSFEERQSARDAVNASTDTTMAHLIEVESAHRDGDNSEPQAILINVNEQDKLEAYAREALSEFGSS